MRPQKYCADISFQKRSQKQLELLPVLAHVQAVFSLELPGRVRAHSHFHSTEPNITERSVPDHSETTRYSTYKRTSQSDEPAKPWQSMLTSSDPASRSRPTSRCLSEFRNSTLTSFDIGCSWCDPSPPEKCLRTRLAGRLEEVLANTTL